MDTSQEVNKLIKEDTDTETSSPTSITKTDKEVFLAKATKVGTQIVDCIRNGLTESDGCTLAGITLAEYEELRRKAPSFAALIEKEKVQYKLNVMKPITEAIKNGDVTKAQWIAERRFPQEFGSTSKRLVNPNDDDDKNPIQEIVYRIQNGEKGNSLAGFSQILDL